MNFQCTYRGHIVVVTTSASILWLGQFTDVACFTGGDVADDDDLMEEREIKV